MLLLLATACKKPVKPEEKIDPTFESTVLVLNEGSFTKGNADVSAYNATTGQLYSNYFSAQNGRFAGDVLQHGFFYGDQLYLILNNSNRIEVCHKNTLLTSTVINGLTLPRNGVVFQDKAYVTETVSYSGKGRVSVLNLSANSLGAQTTVGIKPEGIIEVNGKLYVANSGDTTVMVLNPTTLAITDTIIVKDGPNSFVKSSDGNLWVLCSGKDDPNDRKAGALIKINVSNNQIIKTLPFTEILTSASNLCANSSGTTLYYRYKDQVRTQEEAAATLSGNVLVDRKFYGIGVEPQSGTLYASTYGFSSAEYAIRYTPQGQVIDSFQVGIGPNGFLFK